jgi:hypothetical protein
VTVNPALDRLCRHRMKTPQIFARARSGPAPQRAVPSPADLVAAIRKPAALQLAEATVHEQHRRRAAVAAEVRRIAAAAHSDPNDRQALRLPVLDGELRDIDAAILKANAERDEARRPHLTQVASTLAPLRAGAVETAVDALDALLSSLALIDAANREILRAGCTVPRFPPIYRNALGGLLQRLRRL